MCVCVYVCVCVCQHTYQTHMYLDRSASHVQHTQVHIGCAYTCLPTWTYSGADNSYWPLDMEVMQWWFEAATHVTGLRR